jgi:hypothetical protein
MSDHGSSEKASQLRGWRAEHTMTDVVGLMADDGFNGSQ